MAARRLPLWRGAVRGPPYRKTVEAQACKLLHVREGGLHPHHHAGESLPHHRRRGSPDPIHLQTPGVAQHLFCSTCGVKSFYRPRSNPDGWSVNARCLDNADALDIHVKPFDGRNWEAHAASLAHLSHETKPALEGRKRDRHPHARSVAHHGRGAFWLNGT